MGWQDDPVVRNEPWANDPVVSAPPTNPRQDAAQSLLSRLPQSVTDLLARAPNIQGSAAGRFVQGMADTPVGAMQLIANLPLGQLLGLSDVVNKRIAEISKTTEAQRGPDAGVDVARIAGNVLSPANLMAVSRIPAAATTTGRIGQGAVIGAGMGAMAPVGEEGNYAFDKGVQIAAGGALGAALPTGWEGAKAAGRIVRNVVDPMLPGGVTRAAGRLGNEVAGARAPQVITALENAQTLVPGSRPTAGQASVPANSAEFAALQRLLAEADPSRYAGSGVEGVQEAARGAAIQGIGQSKAALDAAIAQRAADAARNYSAAYGQVLRADPELARIASNPFFKDAIPDAMRLAQAEGITPRSDMTRFLHFVKLSLDKQLTRAGDTALSNTEKAAVQSVKERLVNWIGQRNPAYEQARAQFAAASQPINQMQVGQELQSALTNTLGSAERPAAFATAVTNAPRTIKQATGSKISEELSDILTPQQLGVVDSVLKDLQRDAAFKELASKGLSAARQKVGVFSDPVPQANFLERTMMIINAITRRIEGKTSKATIMEAAKRVENPQEFARIMRAASPFERRLIIDNLMKYQAAGVGEAQRK